MRKPNKSSPPYHRKPRKRVAAGPLTRGPFAARGRMRPEKLKRLRGMLCRSVDGTVFIRARNPDGSDQDYGIAHCDLQVEVSDGDAWIYRRKGELVIDYSPATLGIGHKAVAHKSVAKAHTS